MGFSSKDILDKMKKQSSDEAANKTENSGHKVVTLRADSKPGEKTKVRIELKLLIAPHADTFQRKIFTHADSEVGYGEKDSQGNYMQNFASPCLYKMYGEDCPSCLAIREADKLFGDSSVAWKRFKAKERGVCYAKIISVSDNFPLKKANVGDVVIFNYSSVAFDELSDSIIRWAEENEDPDAAIDSLFNQNSGKTLNVHYTSPTEGAPTVSVTIPLKDTTIFEDTESKTGQQLFEELLATTPSIFEYKYPESYDASLLTKTRELAEHINAVYNEGAVVVNPGDTREEVETKTKKQPKITNLAASNPTDTLKGLLDESDDDLPFDVDDDKLKDKNKPTGNTSKVVCLKEDKTFDTEEVDCIVCNFSSECPNK